MWHRFRRCGPLLAGLFVTGCGDDVALPGSPDLALLADLSVPVVDLVGPPDLITPPDLVTLPDLVATCSDGLRNGIESDVDCGGICGKCKPGQGCGMSTDCDSGVCLNSICAAPSCSDKAQNQDETDVDCGGKTCPACGFGKKCGMATDCSSMICKLKVCSDISCTDQVKNGAESDIDCGGAQCPRCAAGQGCGGPADCTSGVCTGGICQTPSCSDGVWNGGETDMDCGGPDLCPPCGDGKGCVIGRDCASNVCGVRGLCVAPTCVDGVKNGSESDTDCGGNTCPKCGDGRGCGGARDCKSGVCTGGICQPPSCSDGVQNGGETDIDCGGPGMCPRCVDNRACQAGGDCVSQFCVQNRCTWDYHWPYDEGSGVTIHDIGPHKLDGTAAGMTDWVAGQVGNALHLVGLKQARTEIDGTKILNCPAVPELTLMAWINYEGPNWDDWQVLFAKSGVWELGIDDDHEKLCWWRGGTGNLLCTPFETAIYAKKWTFVAATVSGPNHRLRFYVNGVKVAEGPYALPDLECGTNIFLHGAWVVGSGSPEHFFGSFDNFRIALRELSPTEITSVYKMDAP